MDTMIADLVHRFERGALTRRQVIEALSLLVAGGHATSVAAQQATGMRANGIDHVSILVDDLQRSADFYQDVFGLSQLSEDKPNRILRLGVKRTLVSLRRESESGAVDHFAIAVANFQKDAVTQALTRRGLTPQENIQFGFHIKDPDGVNVQIV
jgi:catechol 2,3-dioxygenase-like lactoylglutathione lyase family enzyme